MLMVNDIMVQLLRITQFVTQDFNVTDKMMLGISLLMKLICAWDACNSCLSVSISFLPSCSYCVSLLDGRLILNCQFVQFFFDFPSQSTWRFCLSSCRLDNSSRLLTFMHKLTLEACREHLHQPGRHMLNRSRCHPECDRRPLARSGERPTIIVLEDQKVPIFCSQSGQNAKTWPSILQKKLE